MARKGRGLIRRPRTLVRVQVALYEAARAGVLLEPADDRWPEREGEDRLRLAVGAAALAAHRLPTPRWEPFRGAAVALAKGLATAEPGPLPGDLVPLERFDLPGHLTVVAWRGPGRTTLRLALVSSPTGPIVVARHLPPRESATPALGALALVLALAADAEARPRLALALGLEGLVSWYRETHRMAAPRHAAAYALDHMRARLDEATPGGFAPGRPGRPPDERPSG